MPTSHPATATATHRGSRSAHAPERVLRWAVVTLLLMLAAVAVSRT